MSDLTGGKEIQIRTPIVSVSCDGDGTTWAILRQGIYVAVDFRDRVGNVPIGDETLSMAAIMVQKLLSAVSFKSTKKTNCYLTAKVEDGYTGPVVFGGAWMMFAVLTYAMLAPTHHHWLSWMCNFGGQPISSLSAPVFRRPGTYLRLQGYGLISVYKCESATGLALAQPGCQCPPFTMNSSQSNISFERPSDEQDYGNFRQYLEHCRRSIPIFSQGPLDRDTSFILSLLCLYFGQRIWALYALDFEGELLLYFYLGKTRAQRDKDEINAASGARNIKQRAARGGYGLIIPVRAPPFIIRHRLIPFGEDASSASIWSAREAQSMRLFHPSF
ncbi:hypothetical protein R3P38DRAFT_3347387 [Favolaschia claudopus]|uniref:Uncharacterized protein n=1 Tax=Favolaschia claudopus TaxID=2862362 RepID=A0AAW0D1G5_9AGAR